MQFDTISISDVRDIASAINNLSERKYEFVEAAAKPELSFMDIASRLRVGVESAKSSLSAIATELGIPSGPSMTRRAAIQAAMYFRSDNTSEVERIIEAIQNDTVDLLLEGRTVSPRDTAGRESTQNNSGVDESNWLKEMAGGKQAETQEPPQSLGVTQPTAEATAAEMSGSMLPATTAMPASQPVVEETATAEDPLFAAAVKKLKQIFDASAPARQDRARLVEIESALAILSESAHKSAIGLLSEEKDRLLGHLTLQVDHEREWRKVADALGWV
jgi:hypothetical protein